MLEGWLRTGIERLRSRPREGAILPANNGELGLTHDERMFFDIGIDQIFRENPQAKAILRLHPRNRVEEAAERYARPRLQAARDGEAGEADPGGPSLAQRVAGQLIIDLDLVLERNAEDPVLRLDHYQQQIDADVAEMIRHEEALARAASAAS